MYKVLSEQKLNRVTLACSNGIKIDQVRKKHGKETCLNKECARQAVDLV